MRFLLFLSAFFAVGFLFSTGPLRPIGAVPFFYALQLIYGSGLYDVAQSVSGLPALLFYISGILYIVLSKVK